MNNGRIWCVVKPTVGLPLFLGGVTVIALTVHAAVLSNTTWMSNYWQGSRAARADAAPPANTNLAQATTESGFSVSVTPVVAGSTGNGTAFVITITPRGGDQPQSVTLVQRADPADGTGSPPTSIR